MTPKSSMKRFLSPFFRRFLFCLIALSVFLSGCVSLVPLTEETLTQEATETKETAKGTETHNSPSKTEEAPKTEETPPAGLQSDGVFRPENLSTRKLNFDQLPAFSGSPYVAVNDNLPFFTKEEITTRAFETYGSLDSLGRCTVALACCGTEIMPKEGEERGSISSIKPTGWAQAQYDCVSGKYLYNRCHLIGWQLSAENANRQNLITGTKYLNVEGMLPFENMVADYVKETKNHVMYRITPVFVGNELLSRGVQIEAYSVEDGGEGICFNVFCYQVQPGVSLDYATGQSRLENATASGSLSSADPDAQTETMVWISQTGTKYHASSSCSNMKNPSRVPLTQAVSQGRGPCSKCY